MQIKDVEKLTGLTAKSIRYYESKGLLTVERNAGNSYREYSEEHVHQLRWIKLCRYLEFRIEEIAELLDKNEEELREVFGKKAEQFQEQIETCEGKRDICKELAKKYKHNPETIEEYNEAIDYLESEEMEELTEKLKEYSCPNLASTIAGTLVLFAPVVWLFYNIKAERWDMLFANAVCAVIGTILLTLGWVHYIAQYRRYRDIVRKQNRKWAWMAAVIIGAMVVSFIAIIGIIILGEKLVMVDDYLFYEQTPLAGKMMIYLVVIPIMLFVILAVAKLSKKSSEEVEEMNDIVFIWNHLGKFRWLAFVLWLIGLYCCVTSVTIVTEDTIICRSPLNPVGTSYHYADVESIETGFGNKNFAFLEYKQKGSFYYKVTLDGKEIVFSQPSVNPDIERYEEETYLELEEFDMALEAIGIPKQGSVEGYGNCDLDKQYVERFLRIIE